MVDVTNATKRRSPAWSTREGPLRVPEITAAFWVIKGLTTAMGESATDYLVHIMAPELAVLIGLVAFAAALAHTRTVRTPVVIELKVDPQDLTPGATLDAITAAAQPVTPATL